MAYWWEDDPRENLFMEITRRADLGADLLAPIAARGGVETPGYALVGAVGPGDLVVHYDSAASRIVGVSRATGERHPQPIWWVARGTYARKAGEQARWLPGISVELAGYTPLAKPVDLAELRRVRAELLGIRDALQTRHPGQSIYFPWIPYQDTLRTFQSYLAKFPRDALAYLPELAAAVAAVEGSSPEPGPTDSMEGIEEEVAVAAGRPRRPSKRRGQGFSQDATTRVAVEAHAMNAALAHYRALGEVTDTSRTSSYDYVVSIDGSEWHVEVKGTTGLGEEVLLTPNEVRHAAEYPHVALVVVEQIELARDDAGEVTTNGGRMTVHHPWSLDPRQLTPIGYKYRVSDPASSPSSA